VTRLANNNDKDLYWGPGCQKTLKGFPEEVQDIFLQTFLFAQKGSKHPDAKPLKGFHGASVLEIVVPFDTNAYRAVYTTRFTDAIYVLHIFQKKSKSGIATPKKEIDLIKKRLKQIEAAQKKEKNR
jgi:phage-related protein